MIKVYYKVVVRDKNGKVRYIIRRKSKSFVKNFMEYLNKFFKSGTMTLKDINGNDHYIVAGFLDVDNYFETPRLLVGEGIDDCGIVLGSGTTPPTPDDFKLENQIPHGDETGKLHYMNNDCSEVQVSGNEITFEITRDFINNSGGDITIGEMGLILDIDYKKGGTYYTAHVLMIRDVFDTPVTVLAGGSLSAKYTIKVVT